jgi:hypothetical protein
MSRPIAAPFAAPVVLSTSLALPEVRALSLPIATGTIPPLHREVCMSAARAKTPERRPVRVRRSHVEWVAERLGERDEAIIETVHKLKVVTGSQLERLHFYDLSPASSARIRRRVLHRLVAWRVLMTLERRIGGVRAGSSGLVFSLDTAGQQLVRSKGADGRSARRPDEPSPLLLSHRLGIAELYVALMELARSEDFTLADFTIEPACWWPNGYGGWLKPDAYFRLASADYTDSWWLEQDQGTEHLPVIRRKLMAYLDFARRGLGPHDVVPRVLVSVPTEQRETAVETVICGLPEPALQLLHVTCHALTPKYLLQVLKQ